MLEVGNALRRSGREDIAIKSICKNTIAQQYRKEFDCGIDIISVSKKGSTFFVKTHNPLINAQLLEIDAAIKKELQSQLKALGIVYQDVSLRYL